MHEACALLCFYFMLVPVDFTNIPPDYFNGPGTTAQRQ